MLDIWHSNNPFSISESTVPPLISLESTGMSRPSTSIPPSKSTARPSKCVSDPGNMGNTGGTGGFWANFCFFRFLHLCFPDFPSIDTIDGPSTNHRQNFIPHSRWAPGDWLHNSTFLLIHQICRNVEEKKKLSFFFGRKTARQIKWLSKNVGLRNQIARQSPSVKNKIRFMACLALSFFCETRR